MNGKDIEGEIFFLLSLLVFILVLGWANFNFNPETIEIAIAVPQSNTAEASLALGREMIEGAQFLYRSRESIGKNSGEKTKISRL